MRQLAAYSANLVVLRLNLTPDGRLTRSPQLAQDWSSLVALWHAGLDPDAWLATLGAMTLDRRDGTIRTQPPSHGRTFPEYDSARLVDDARTAAQLGLGAAVLHGTRTIFTADDWWLQMQSWLVPAIAFGHLDHIVTPTPPARASRPDRDKVARLLMLLLRTRVTELTVKDARQVIGLLLELDRSPDPVALALAICEHPRLLVEIPALGDARLYRDSPATAMLLYVAQKRVNLGEFAEWEALYRGVSTEGRFSTERDGMSLQEAEVLVRQLISPANPAIN